MVCRDCGEVVPKLRCIEVCPDGRRSRLELVTPSGQCKSASQALGVYSWLGKKKQFSADVLAPFKVFRSNHRHTDYSIRKLFNARTRSSEKRVRIGSSKLRRQDQIGLLKRTMSARFHCTAALSLK